MKIRSSRDVFRRGQQVRTSQGQRLVVNVYQRAGYVEYETADAQIFPTIGAYEEAVSVIRGESDEKVARDLQAVAAVGAQALTDLDRLTLLLRLPLWRLIPAIVWRRLRRRLA